MELIRAMDFLSQQIPVDILETNLRMWAALTLSGEQNNRINCVTLVSLVGLHFLICNNSSFTHFFGAGVRFHLRQYFCKL